MKPIIPYFLIIIALFSCNQKEKNKILVKEQIKIQEINTAKENTLKTFTYEDISRYTMASIMGQSPKIIKAIKNGNLYYVSYTRKSDNKKFDYKIKFDGNKIFWANIDGRWRNSQYDEKISFRENRQILFITQVFSDGSEDIQEYKKGE
jgi:predicted SnoaL-like aldol condensation-catalyzing enzyme